MGRKALTYSEYLASDAWECSASPTNAHHWKEIQFTAKGQDHTGLFYCKYCMETRKFPVEFNANYNMED